jgi:DNA-binding NarL/FixJ family response regulator
MKKVGRLTERQRQVLCLLAEGKRMKDVGAILNICHSTVAFHKYRIMELLYAENDADLVSTTALISMTRRISSGGSSRRQMGLFDATRRRL